MEQNAFRRKSSGKSNILEGCIKTLEGMIKVNDCDLEEISIFVVNNTLPSELRSIAWKIFLGILPRDQHTYEWVKIIKTERAKFEAICLDKEVDQFTKVLRKEADENTLESGSLLQDYQLGVKELENISTFFDFFKSQIVAETLLRLFIIWKKNNSDLKHNREAFYILAGIIYALYPSIIKFTTETKYINNEEDLDPKTLFYFLNDEEYFDADVYLIYDFLMNKKELKSLINEFDTFNRQDSETIKNEILDVEELFPMSDEKRTFISSLNRYEKISYVYLKLSNQDLLSKLFAIEIDPYEIVRDWSISLLNGAISFESIPYFWDNIFLHSISEERQFEFLDYLTVALFSQVISELLTCDISIQKKNLRTYPELSLNLKEIIKKSMKLKEKISEFI